MELATNDEIDARIERLQQFPFRRRFRLRGRERALVELRGMTAIRQHAEELVAQRLAPAEPRNDGRQTPYRGHPVFVAQHATATCCRSCLARDHDIAKGADLTAAQRDYVLEVITRWIERDFAAGPASSAGPGRSRPPRSPGGPAAPR